MPAKTSLESLWSDFPFTTESFFWACPEIEMADVSSENDVGTVKEPDDDPDA